MVLAGLEQLHIRALFSQTSSAVSLRRVALEVAGEVGGGPPASNVELCMCPANYLGDSCQVRGAGSLRCLPRSPPARQLVCLRLPPSPVALPALRAHAAPYAFTVRTRPPPPLHAFVHPLVCPRGRPLSTHPLGRGGPAHVGGLLTGVRASIWLWGSDFVSPASQGQGSRESEHVVPGLPSGRPCFLS